MNLLLLTLMLTLSCSNAPQGGDFAYSDATQYANRNSSNQQFNSPSQIENPNTQHSQNQNPGFDVNVEGDEASPTSREDCKEEPTKKDVSFKGVKGDTVPGYLWTPGCAQGQKFPAVLGMYGISGDKDSGTIRDVATEFARKGIVTLTIDWIGTGDRMPEISKTTRALDVSIAKQTIGDYGKAVDFLSSHESVDASRIGYLGASMGAMTGIGFAASEPRLKAVVYFVPIVNPLWGSYAPENKIRSIKQPLYCFYTTSDTSDSVCKNASGSNVKLKEFPGGHELKGHEKEATELASEFLNEHL